MVFNTSMTGYQEILTDPSYVGQIVCMTYPEMGNFGVNRGDEESARPHAVRLRGARADAEEPSNWRARESRWTPTCGRTGWSGICGIDTRRADPPPAHRRARRWGSSPPRASAAALVERARSAARAWRGRTWPPASPPRTRYVWSERGADAWTAAERRRAPAPRFHVVAYDYGLKRAMLRLLVERRLPGHGGARAHPRRGGAGARRPTASSSPTARAIPAAVTGARETVAALLGKVPVFGICLGHQILALAVGARPTS